MLVGYCFTTVVCIYHTVWGYTGAGAKAHVGRIFSRHNGSHWTTLHGVAQMLGQLQGQLQGQFTGTAAVTAFKPIALVSGHVLTCL